MKKVFYFHKQVKVNITVKPSFTRYTFKMPETTETFNIDLPLDDSFEAREYINKYIDKLGMN